jgi:hypothetical protein
MYVSTVHVDFVSAAAAAAAAAAATSPSIHLPAFWLDTVQLFKPLMLLAKQG